MNINIYNTIKNLTCLILIAFLLSLTQCTESHHCEAFDMEHPLLDISVSPSLEDSLTFISDKGDTVLLLKGFTYSPSETIHCLTSDQECECLSSIDICYYTETDDFRFWCEIWGRDFVKTKIRQCDYLFVTDDIFITHKRLDNNQLDIFYDDSLGMQDVTIDKKLFPNVISFEDPEAGSNTIHRVWIQKGTGLIKFWKGDDEWTREP